MRNKWGLIILSALFSIISVHQPTAAERGVWYVSVAQGYAEHTVKNGTGNRFTISCGEAALQGASIWIEIKGRRPADRSDVRIYLDDEDYTFRADRGGVDTESRVDSENFRAMWNDLLRTKTLRVVFANGDTSSFGTGGLRKALGKTPCKTGYQM